MKTTAGNDSHVHRYVLIQFQKLPTVESLLKFAKLRLKQMFLSFDFCFFFFSLVFNFLSPKGELFYTVYDFLKTIFIIFFYFFKNIVSFMFRYNKRLMSFQPGRQHDIKNYPLRVSELYRNNKQEDIANFSQYPETIALSQSNNSFLYCFVYLLW